MPNWCDNELTVGGLKDRVGAFMDAVTKDGQLNLDFNAFVPYPDEYAQQDQVADAAREAWEALPEDQRPPYSTVPKDGYNSGGHEWCTRNWGTKWNVGPKVREIAAPKPTATRKSVRLSFATAWTPPAPVVLAMSRRFPDLTFTLKYWECGMGFRGTYRARQGECLEETCDNSYRGHRGG